MSETPQPPLSDAQITKLEKRTRWLRIWLIAVVSLVIVLAGSGGYLGRRKAREVEDSLEEARFSEFVSSYEENSDFVSPTVNTIQFLRRGYSISFDRVDYNQNGLALSGEIGNPTQIWISSLALEFSARPFPYQIKEKWAKQKFGWWSEDWTIGTAQTTVGFLNPGRTSYFTVTIPNVRQTPDGFQVAVSFRGERYQYLGPTR